MALVLNGEKKVGDSTFVFGEQHDWTAHHRAMSRDDAVAMATPMSERQVADALRAGKSHHSGAK